MYLMQVTVGMMAVDYYAYLSHYFHFGNIDRLELFSLLVELETQTSYLRHSAD